MWSLSSWLKNKDETVVDMQEPLLDPNGVGSYIPPSLPAHCLDRHGSYAISDQLPVSDRLPTSSQPSGHLISFSCPATPDTSCSGCAETSSRARGPRSTGSQDPCQHSSPQTNQTRGPSNQSPAISAARRSTDNYCEGEIRHAGLIEHRATHDEHGYIARQSSWRDAKQARPAGRRSSLERQPSQDEGEYCQRCRPGSPDRRPSREVIGARRPSRHTQDSLAGFLGQHSPMAKCQLVSLPPSPFSILHHPQQELLRSPSSADEEHAYEEMLRRPSSTPRETASAEHSRRSSMLSRLGSNQVQAAPPDHALESMHSVVPHSYSWVPVMHADAEGATSILNKPALQQARDAMRVWHGALKWVALWLTLSVLTLLHAFGLVHAMANVSLAKVCAGLFCWTGVLGVVGSSKGLISECLVHHRSDTVAAANALGLKSVSMIAFMSAVLSCLACLVHGFVLNLLSQQNPHLPPCDPNIPLCAETYNLILVLMVATMVMYGAHGAVSAVVAHRAHHARQILRSGNILQV